MNEDFEGQADINRVLLRGHLKEAPTLRKTKKDAPVTNLLLIVKEENDQESWHDIVVWDALALDCVNKLTAGTRIKVVGRLENEKIPIEGKKITRPKIHALSIDLL